MSVDQISEAVFEAIEEFNRVEGQAIPKAADVVLFGEGGTLDSMGLVTLILAIEGKVSGRLGVEVALTSEKAMSQRNSPFRTVHSLCEFIREVVDEQSK